MNTGGKRDPAGLVESMRGKRLSRDAALRIGAIGLVVVVAALVLPGLLSPPEPPPLPADVGLGATGASGAEGPMAEAPELDRPKSERKDASAAQPSHDARGEGGLDEESRERTDGDRDDREPERTPAPQPAPQPSPAPVTAPAPAAAPAPVYVAPGTVAQPPPPAAEAPGEFGP